MSATSRRAPDAAPAALESRLAAGKKELDLDDDVEAVSGHDDAIDVFDAVTVYDDEVLRLSTQVLVLRERTVQDRVEIFPTELTEELAPVLPLATADVRYSLVDITKEVRVAPGLAVIHAYQRLRPA